jgi:hypothetical protein
MQTTTTTPPSSAARLPLGPPPRPATAKRRDRRRFHRRIGGISLIGAPAFLLASELAYRGTNDPAQLVTDARSHHGAIVLAIVCILISSVLLIPAAFTILHLARDRGRRLAEAATALCVLGALGHAAWAGFTTIQLSTAQGSRAEMTELLRRVNHTAAAAPVGLCILAFAVGVLVLALAAWRSGLAPAPVAMLIGTAVLIEVANVKSYAGGAAKEALALAALGWIGIRVLRLPDEAWDATRP